MAATENKSNNGLQGMEEKGATTPVLGTAFYPSGLNKILNINNPAIVNEFNRLRKNNPELVKKLQQLYPGYNIHVWNNKLHISKYKPKGGSCHKKHTRRHKKQKRTRRHRKH